MDACLAVEREEDKVLKKLRTLSGSASEKLQKIIEQVNELRDQLDAGMVGLSYYINGLARHSTVIWSPTRSVIISHIAIITVSLRVSGIPPALPGSEGVCKISEGDVPRHLH